MMMDEFIAKIQSPDAKFCWRWLCIKRHPHEEDAYNTNWIWLPDINLDDNVDDFKFEETLKDGHHFIFATAWTVPDIGP